MTILRFCVFFLVFSLAGYGLSGQQVRVLSEVTGKVVENVAVYNQQKTFSTITNPEGIAEIGSFPESDSIFFQHASFNILGTTRAALSQMNYTVWLERRVMMLDEFVISAHKWEQDKREVPNKIEVIRIEEISFSNPQTAADLLGISGEVFIQKSQLGGGSPMIRGFSANALLLVIDGVRMNNAIYRSGNLQNVISLDPHTIESSEIIFGPGSVIYGSDAMGGVMDFHTKKVLLPTSDRPIFRLNALTRYSSANNEKTAHLDFNLGRNRWGFLSSITFSDFGDLTMGSRGNSGYIRPEYVDRIGGKDSIVINPDPNKQVYSGYSQINLMQKVRYRVSDDLNFVYSFHYSALSDVPRYDRLIQYKGSLLRYASWYYGPQKWMMNCLQADYYKPGVLFDNVRFSLAWQTYEESRHDRKYRNDILNHRTEKPGILSANMDFTKETDRGLSLFYGFEGLFNNVTSLAESENISTGTLSPLDTRYPDGGSHYYNISVYGSAKKNFSEKFTLLAGIRYNFIKLSSVLSDNTFYNFPFSTIDNSNSAFNGSVGLVYHPTISWQVNLNASTGFRAPNLDDTGKIFESEPGNVVVPNPDLKPEYAYNIDLGIVRSIHDRVKINMTGFATLVTNVMVRRDFLFNSEDSIMYNGELSKVEAVVNEERALIYGASFSLFAQPVSFFSLRSFLTWSAGKTNEDIPLRHIPPLFGGTHLVFTWKQIKTDFYADYHGGKPFEKMAPSEIAKPEIYASDEEGNPCSPAWFTLNMKASWNLKETLGMSAGVENILDHRYRTYSSGIVAPGRNFIISLRLFL